MHQSRSPLHSVTVRLAAPILILVGVLSASIGFGVLRMGTLADSTHRLGSVEMPGIASLMEVSDSINEVYLAERGILSAKVGGEAYQRDVERHASALARAGEALGAMAERTADPAVEAMLVDAGDQLSAWRSTSQEVLSMRAEDSRMGRLLAIDLSDGDSRQGFEALAASLDAIRDGWLDAAAANVSSLVDDTRDGNRLLLVVCAASVLFGVIVAIVLPLRLRRRLTEIRRLIDDITEGEGDLTRRIAVNSGDEIGQIAESFNRFCESLHATVSETRQAAVALAASVQQISSGNRQLAEQAERQVLTVNEASDGLAQVTESIATTARRADSVSTSASATSESAERGTDGIRSTASAMEDIGESSRQISDIISVVDSISFQTNILALNAAVEAARAGEQGRGFAVVASEVRALAQKSATAADDIKNLIATATERVELGTELVGSSGGTLERIIESIREVSENISEISAAASEQDRGVQEINSSIARIREAMQSSSTFVSEIAGASSHLERQSGELMDLVARFKVRDESGSATPLPTAG